MVIFRSYVSLPEGIEVTIDQHIGETKGLNMALGIANHVDLQQLRF